MRIAISRCFFTYFPALLISFVLIYFLLFSVSAKKLSMNGLIRNFEKLNFTPKSSIFVSLKVKLPNMTDWLILPGLEIDVLIACCRLSVSPRIHFDGANSVHLRHETTTRYSLKATTKISPHSRNKNVPILRSQNTQNTRTPLKTGSEQSVMFLFIRQWGFDPFQMDQPKTRLIST